MRRSISQPALVSPVRPELRWRRDPLRATLVAAPAAQEELAAESVRMTLPVDETRNASLRAERDALLVALYGSL